VTYRRWNGVKSGFNYWVFVKGGGGGGKREKGGGVGGR